MGKVRNIIFAILLTMLAVSACDKYNTDVVGEDFAPYNSIVTKFKQLVYVEYSKESVKVWGPHAKDIDYNVEGANLTITSNLDSLALFVYGHAIVDTVSSTHGSLYVNSPHPFALYLNGLSLSSESGPAIRCSGSEFCYFVLPSGVQNRIWGSVEVDGHLILDGDGAVRIYTTTDDGLIAKQGLTCSYPVSINVTAEDADGVSAESDEIKIADGKWHIAAGHNAFTNKDAAVVFNGGKIYGTARDGSFVNAPVLTANGVTCIGAAAEASSVDQDMRQFVWMGHFSNYSLYQDSTITIMRMASDTTKLGTFTPDFDIDNPWLVISTPTLAETDLISIE